VIEDLQTAWEAKLADAKYALYHDAISDGLEKLKKYYSRFDQKPSFILALGESAFKPFLYENDNENFI